MPSTEPEIQAAPVAHLPVLRALIDELGIHAIIDEFLPQHPLSRVSDADCVVTMILNVLCGRVALFRMDEWLARTDAELLLGPGCPADAFDDSRLAASLDHVDALGTDNLITAVVRRFYTLPDRETTYSVHQDFTTLSLHGEYEDVSPWGPIPAFGRSKDLRPDLKQLVFGLSIHGSAGIPLVCSMLNGNTSDPFANRDHLARLSKLLPPEDEVTIVGDCKLVDAKTLGQLLCSGFHFVSLLPDAYTLRKELVRDAWATELDVSRWPLLGSHAGRRKADPHTQYRGRSVERRLPVLLHKVPSTQHPGPSEGVRALEQMRFLVIHSDALAAAFDAQLPKRLASELDAVAAFVTKTNKAPAKCEKDAVSGALKGMPKLRFHGVGITACAEERPVKRKGRGRPPKGELEPVETVWIVTATTQLLADAIVSAKQHASCFPLVTDHLDTPGWDDARILAEYRHQGIVEGNTGFRWLKGPAAAAPMFLKTNTRIRALGAVMVLALMVRNLWQFRMRTAAKEACETITHPFTKREVKNLTAEMAMEHFGGIQSVQFQQADGRWKRLRQKVSEVGLQILKFLRVSETVFWTAPIRKSVPRTI